jgi:tetrapyrrole methylase family protein / MazG family protein
LRPKKANSPWGEILKEKTSKHYDFNDLARLMRRLRGPNGCPWDREQTHKSLVRYLREESKEVERAIRRKDYENLCEELGDLLHQIVFHAQLAREKGRFTIGHVVDGLCRKMLRRHPHVFGGRKLKTTREVMVQWDKLKREEKKKGIHRR